MTTNGPLSECPLDEGSLCLLGTKIELFTCKMLIHFAVFTDTFWPKT